MNNTSAVSTANLIASQQEYVVVPPTQHLLDLKTDSESNACQIIENTK